MLAEKPNRANGEITKDLGQEVAELVDKVVLHDARPYSEEDGPNRSNVDISVIEEENRIYKRFYYQTTERYQTPFLKDWRRLSIYAHYQIDKNSGKINSVAILGGGLQTTEALSIAEDILIRDKIIPDPNEE